VEALEALIRVVSPDGIPHGFEQLGARLFVGVRSIRQRIAGRVERSTALMSRIAA